MVPSLHLLLLLVGAVVQAYIIGDLSITANQGTSSVTLTNHGIYINDSTTNRDQICIWGYDSCYCECNFMNDTCNEMALDCLLKTNVSMTDGTASFNICSSLCHVTPCKGPAINSLLHKRPTASSWKNLWRIFTIRSMCPDLFKRNITIKRSFLDIERVLIQTLLDEPFSGWPIIYNNRYLSVYVVPISNLTSNSEGMINIPAPQLIPDSSFIPETWFPAEVIKNFPAENISLGLVTYPSSQQFQISIENIKSLAIRIELSIGNKLANLSQPIMMQFPYTGQVNELQYPVCHFFQETGEDDFQCKSDTSASIHVSLSGALTLLNTSFLLSEWGASLGMAWVCVLIAAVMHYSLLCSFSWMALEALHLYLMLVKVFNTYYKHYMVKISILGWGVPCVIVGVSLAVTARNTLLYGLSEMAMLNTNQTNNICWIKDETFLLSVNLAFFSMVFLFSSGVLITVSFRICSLKHYNKMCGTRDKPRAHHLPTCKDVCTVLGLSCLLGTTWGLAFLSLQNLNYTVLYLFSILNSLQGFFIFLWMWARARNERKRLAENKSSTTDSSTPTKNPHH
ncbi:uncharacterized protein LOC134028308 [Osmerus eperlanus]|uniref:uncharacterized protein LOC134028308 n=1 Tax=Osmerus eperlanus TaxID=29151 RepID=UPI002E0E020F